MFFLKKKENWLYDSILRSIDDVVFSGLAHTIMEERTNEANQFNEDKQFNRNSLESMW